MKLSDLKRTGTTILAKGPEGTGKSRALASFPGRTKIYDLDLRGLALVEPFKDREDDFEIEQFGPDEFPRFIKDFEELQDRCDFDNVFLDGLTALDRMLVTYTLGLPSSGKSVSRGIIKIPQFEDWNALNNAINKVVSIGRNLTREKGVNFFLTAHLIETSQKASTGGYVQRLLTGAKAVAGEIPGYFNDIWYFYTDMDLDKPKYMCRVAPSDIITAKSTDSRVPITFNWTDKNFYKEMRRLIEENTITDVFAQS